SREKIVKEMIIERNMCYFDTISQHFIIMDADQQKQHCK
ncbi:T3SS effector NleG family protein, partial [Escherichia coli]